MDKTRCDKVIQFALLEAGRQDDYDERELGPIHLIKYAYLADLEYAEHNDGQTFTGAAWIFFHYGPWAQEVYARIEPALDAIHAEKELIPSTKYDGDFVRWKINNDHLHQTLESELPLPVVGSVRRCVRKYGRDTAELLNHVYTTAPMLRAAPRDPLVFFVADPAGRSPAATPPVLTARQEKKRRERVEQARDDVKAKLAARRAGRASRQVAVAPPRYDEVFFQGLTWLDQLGGSSDNSVDCEAEFDDDVWSSDTRGEHRE